MLERFALKIKKEMVNSREYQNEENSYENKDY